jgi:hypothetical protein
MTGGVPERETPLDPADDATCTETLGLFEGVLIPEAK